jgi:hypothetical protein
VTNGEKMVWAAAFALAVRDTTHGDSRGIASDAGMAADEAVRLLRLRAEHDADAREMIGA